MRHTLPPVPLVGRDAELASLTATLRDAVLGRAQTVFLAGEGGAGKTRLARQIADLAREQGLAVAEGRAFAVETGVPYAIFTDALLPLLRGLEPGALTVLTRGAGSDLAPILPALFTPAGRAGESPAEGKARMHWSFAQLVGRLAERRPLLLVLDNVHWADDASLELLHFLARQAHAGAIDGHLFILATYADAERDDAPVLRSVEQSLASIGAARTVRLAPLSAEQTIELVQRTFGEPAAAVREFALSLHAWTRGNPFFVDETLKSLVESRQLAHRGGRWEGWSTESLVPSRSVRDVVLERVARLGAGARELLDLCAVLGARIRLATLRAVSPIAEPALLDDLDELRRANFLVEVPGHDAAYDFAHPLVRDAVYASLGRARAQGMHDGVAESLERAYGDDALSHADELAFHFTHGSSGDASAGAVRYLAAAGRQALARYADSAAASYLQAALDASAAGTLSNDERWRIVEALARVRQRLGELDAARDLWRRARDGAVAAGDAARVAAVERRMGLMSASAGEHAEAIGHFDAGLAAIGVGDQPALEARLRLARATSLHALGRSAEALDDAGAALRAASALGDRALLARAHRGLLLLYAWTGPSDAARAHGEQAALHAAASGEKEVEWSAHWAMAVHAGLTGDAESTARHARESERLAEEIRSPVLRLWTADVTIEYLAGVGDWQGALAASDRAIPLARALGQRTLLPRLLVWTGLVHRALGDMDRARELIEEAWRLTGAGERAAAATSDVHAVVPAYTGMAGWLMANSEHARALAVGEAGLAIADRAGYVAWAIYRLLPFIIETSLYLEDFERAARHNARLRRDSEGLGHALGLAWADTTDALLAYLTGEPARAVPLLRAARAALESVPFVFDAARLRRFIARALADAGDAAGAAHELREAHAIFVRLGARREIGQTREELRLLGERLPTPRVRNAAAGGLSAREAEIARLVAARKSNKEIGSALAISDRTVSTHLSNIFGKLGVGTRGELTDLVRGWGET